MSKKNNRKRKTGWAFTTWFPHGRHPAHYRHTDKGNEEIEYITFTHSPEIQLKGGKVERTVPMLDNISKKEREENKRKGLKQGENRSFAYPKVYEGKRSALGKESDGFAPVPFDDARIGKMYEVFPHENVPKTGGKTKYKKKKTPRHR